MIEVSITEIENAGSFLCRPKTDGGDEAYADFLASLNSYFLRNSVSSAGDLFVPKVGEIAACYTAVGDSDTVGGSDKLWYRGMVSHLYNNRHGLCVRVLLVDKGEQKYVTKARMRKLPSQFQGFPHQSMKCVLNDLVPVTLSANSDLLMSLKTTNHWDIAATKFVEELLEGSSTFIQVHSQDDLGTRFVTLYCQNGNTKTNVNELLISKKYCTLKQAQNFDKNMLMPDIPAKADNQGTGFLNTNNYLISPNKSPSDAVQPATPEEVLRRSEERRRQKEEKKKEIGRHIDKECKGLLDLLKDDITTTPERTSVERTGFPSSSGASDLSDIESTPVPKDASYKNAHRYSSLASDIIGKSNTEHLANALGLKPQSKESKIEEYLNTELPQSFDIVDEKQELEVQSRLSHLTEGQQLITALTGGKKRLTKEVNQLDVLVWGKEKRPPMSSLGTLNLPEPMVTYLKSLNFDKPTQFQMNMWPAILALRDVVGIADVGNSSAARVLAYLLPLLKNLIMDNVTYPDLGSGNGPFLIICVSEWQEAQVVFDLCHNLLEFCKGMLRTDKKTLRVDIRYGGMDMELQRNVRMLNGCEILVTTVMSLNNAIESGYTNLNRLCHLVFDNAHKVFNGFTEDVQTLMKSYEATRKANSALTVNQIIVVGMKWAASVNSFMKSCMKAEPLVIISNKVEVALFAQVPIVVELCNASDRLECLLGFLETEAANESSVVFTSSARSAEDLQKNLHTYGIAANVITKYAQPSEIKDAKLAWNTGVKSKGMNVLVVSDPANVDLKLRNATVVVHYDFPQKKDFGNRLMCLLQNIQDNETREKPKPLLSQIFITEKHNSMRYSTGLEKLLRRSGQRVPEKLKSMAESMRELKEEEKQYQELCPRLKLFGKCRFIDDCTERHTIFPSKDLLGLVPNTGFVKVKILDVVSASCYYGRIIEHKLPFEGRPYDTTVYLTLTMDMNLHYAVADNRKRCPTAEKYDICVIKSEEFDYQRVRIEKIVEKDFERPRKLEVYGIDNGFTKTVNFEDLLICDEKFKMVPHQAIEIIACCVQPVEHGTSWTHEASYTMEQKVKGKVLEGRVKLSLQNTMWVDPLTEKELLEGMQTMTYTLDVGRELINANFAEKNGQHLDELRKLLYDVQGISMEVKTENKGLPLHMVGHDEEYLSEDGFEEVYVSSVTHPGLFFVQRAEQRDRLDKLDAKIDATMKVTKMDPELLTTTLPNGYICVAKYSGDEKWYRAKILAVNEKTGEYDIFFVDHGDREWIGKSKVVPGWADIMSLPFQAIECRFSHITPRGRMEWRLEDGDKLWDMTLDKLLQIQALQVGPSSYITDRIMYDVEIYDTTGNININISHELVYAGIADGNLECLQEIFPNADTKTKRQDKSYKHESDQISDICVEIYLNQNNAEKVVLAKEITRILKAESNYDILDENGTIMSICKLLALNHHEDTNEELLVALQYPIRKSSSCCDCLHDNNGLQIMLNILLESEGVNVKKTCLKTLKILSRDIWYQGTILDLNVMPQLIKMITSSTDSQFTSLLVDLLGLLCDDNTTGCTQFRQQNGLEILSSLLIMEPVKFDILDSCAKTFLIILHDVRSKERVRESGALQEIASVICKQLNDATLLSYLQVLSLCMVDNELNREYLHRLNVHSQLRRISQLPVRYSAPVKTLFQDLINLITPGPLTSFLLQSNQEIDPSFYEKKKEERIPHDEKPRKGAPMTYWSQMAKSVVLSIHLRGVEADETSVEPYRVKFKTCLDNVEYELDLSLYGKVDEKDYAVEVKGGEVLIKLTKAFPSEWPRLLESKEKFPYIRYDFDRWQEDIPGNRHGKIVDQEDDDDYVPFLPGLPPPPKSEGGKDLHGQPAPMFDPSDYSDSSGDESDDDDYDDGDGGFYRNERGDDFFRL